MLNNGQLDGEQKFSIDDSLVKLAEVLKAMGVEELTIEKDFQYHLLSSSPNTERALINSFCEFVDQIHSKVINADTR